MRFAGPFSRSGAWAIFMLGLGIALIASFLAFLSSELLISILCAVSVILCFSIFYLLFRSNRIIHAEANTLGSLMSQVAEGDFSIGTNSFASASLQSIQIPFRQMTQSIAELIALLSDQKSELAAILETMDDGVMVIDGSNNVSLANQAVQDLLEVKAPIGERFSTVFRDYEFQELVELARAEGDQRVAEVDLPILRKTISVTATPLRKDPVEGILVLITTHNLTAVKRLETTRREFVANVSHELRSPLASIKAMVETLEDGALDERKIAMDFLLRVRQEVDRMTTIVNDLLTLSQIESKVKELDKALVDIEEIANGVVTVLEPRIATAKVKVLVKNEAPEPIFQGDEAKLKQVIFNLLDNALKYTSDGDSINLVIEKTEDTDSRHVLKVNVTDNGEGISVEHLPHLFERFYKANRSRHDSGTGLGLAIAKHIVESHGGEVGVESKPGAGSNFWFTVPVD